MRLKNFTLKAHCASCSGLIHSQTFLVNLDLIKTDTHLEGLLYDQFPQLNGCRRCASQEITKSYTCFTHVRLTDPSIKKDKADIERAQNQIAATYDFNNDMTSAQRKAVRAAFQKQLTDLLNKNNISS